MSEGPTVTERIWEPEEISQHLRQLPAFITYATKEVLEADKAVRERKHVIAMAEAAVRVSKIGEKLTATDFKAISLSENPELYHELIALEITLAAKEMKVQYWRDLWDSCRKAANLMIEEGRRLEGTVSRRTQ